MICTSLIPALGRQRQADLCELMASLIYIASSRPGKATVRSCFKLRKKERDRERERERERDRERQRERKKKKKTQL